MSRNILALDIATTTGWAVGKAGNLVASGEQELKQDVWDGGGVRVLRMRQLVEDLVDIWQPEVVFFEKVEFVGATAAAHMYGALMGAMAGVLETHEIPYVGVGTGGWKKVFTGNGGASKAQVAAVAQALKGTITTKLKGGVQQSDEADAIGILIFGMKAMRERRA